MVFMIVSVPDGYRIECRSKLALQNDGSADDWFTTQPAPLIALSMPEAAAVLREINVDKGQQNCRHAAAPMRCIDKVTIPLAPDQSDGRDKNRSLVMLAPRWLFFLTLQSRRLAWIGRALKETGNR